MKKSTVILLLVALICTLVAVPLYSYTPAIYGSPSIIDLGFIKDYIVAWWHKLVRRYIYGEVGPAENATANTQQAQQYQLPQTKTTNEPTNIYELIAYFQRNKATFSAQILAYLQENNLPNKSTQIDLFIVPENIYVTIVWNEASLEIYSGWIGDQNCKEYIVATATSSLIMNLYQNRNNMETCKSLILNAEAKGEFTYSLKRINPTIAELVFYLQLISTITSIISSTAWLLLYYQKLQRK